MTSKSRRTQDSPTGIAMPSTVRSLDWVDRLAGVDDIEADEMLEGEWVLYPQGPWLTWPAWRRLLDLFRAKVIALPAAAGLALWYRVTVNPSNRWREDGDLTYVPMHVVFNCYRALWGINLGYCASCDDPIHSHRPNPRTAGSTAEAPPSGTNSPSPASPPTASPVDSPSAATSRRKGRLT